jgi:cytoskeletal protein CcmA (bactofilin family)
MFNKKNEESGEFEKIEPLGRPVIDEPEVRKRKTSVIGPTLKFSGELTAAEDLIIEGEIEGTISHNGKSLTVGKEGRVKADIAAKTVEIYGTVEGNVRGEDVVKLAKSSQVIGNISCTRIIMEDGAQFSGSIDMNMRKDSASEAAPRPVQTVKKKSPKKTAEVSG